MRKLTVFCLTLGLLIWSWSGVAQGQDSRKKSSSVRVGLSLGLRLIADFRAAQTRQIAISAIDTTLLVNGLDIADLNLSGVVVAFPWKRTEVPRKATPDDTSTTQWNPNFLSRLGFLANVNITQIAPQNTSFFNKSVEGGIGLVYKIGDTDDFGIAATYERVFSRRLRQPQLEGNKLLIGDETLTSVSLGDDRFFVDDPLSAVSLRFVFFF